jgi:hypothetical protein
VAKLGACRLGRGQSEGASGEGAGPAQAGRGGLKGRARRSRTVRPSRLFPSEWLSRGCAPGGPGDKATPPPPSRGTRAMAGRSRRRGLRSEVRPAWRGELARTCAGTWGRGIGIGRLTRTLLDRPASTRSRGPSPLGDARPREKAADHPWAPRSAVGLPVGGPGCSKGTRESCHSRHAKRQRAARAGHTWRTASALILGYGSGSLRSRLGPHGQAAPRGRHTLSPRPLLGTLGAAGLNLVVCASFLEV